MRLPRAAIVLGLQAIVACNLAIGIEEAEVIPSLGVGGGTTSCNADPECNDDNPCTIDHCVDSLCVFDPLEGQAPFATQILGDCHVIMCSGGQSSSVVDDTDHNDDMQECTDDVCMAGMVLNAPKDGATCNQNGGRVCNEDGECVECVSNAWCTAPETCFGGGEAWLCGCTPNDTCAALDISCGGLMDDCSNFENCNNNAKDGTETDIDCGGATILNGGSCDVRCIAGKACAIPSDCASNMCNGMICG